MRLSNSTLERRAGNGLAKYFVPLPLTKWELFITGWHHHSHKKAIRHWLREIVIAFRQNYVRYYMLLLEVHLGQFNSENAALVNLTP